MTFSSPPENVLHGFADDARGLVGSVGPEGNLEKKEGRGDEGRVAKNVAIFGGLLYVKISSFFWWLLASPNIFGS